MFKVVGIKSRRIEVVYAVEHDINYTNFLFY